MKVNLKDVLIGALTAALLLPFATFAARTAIPVITGLFPTALNVNMAPPVASLGNSTTTGSVYSNGGAALYFAVTALDGAGGETIGTILGTSTIDQAHGWNLTWPVTQGAKSYRVYFSTSTPLAMTQYFNSTSTTAYWFNSTSSPVFIPAGIPLTNTAYAINISSIANSWLLGGKVGIGTSTPQFLLSVINEPAGNGTVSTTTTLFGNQGTTTSHTCFNVNNTLGAPVQIYVNSANALTVVAGKCT